MSGDAPGSAQRSPSATLLASLWANLLLFRREARYGCWIQSVLSTWSRLLCGSTPSLIQRRIVDLLTSNCLAASVGESQSRSDDELREGDVPSTTTLPD
jgi:hypothetical protein